MRHTKLSSHIQVLLFCLRRVCSEFERTRNVFHVLIVLGLVLSNIAPSFAVNFDPRVQYATGSGPGQVIVEDITGDGKPDMIVVNTQSNTVSVLLGYGDGTFQAKVDYDTGTAPVFARIADLQNNGGLYLVVVNKASDSVSILRGNGDGTFEDAVNYPTGSGPVHVSISDVNGDNVADLVVSNSTGASVSVLLGNGDGTFQARTDYPTGAGPVFAKTDDLNGDFNNDLIVVNKTANTISVLLGIGDGTFQGRTDYATGLSPVSVNSNFFNSDDFIDMVVVNSDSNSVSIFAGKGDGTFQDRVDFATGNGPVSVKIEDLDNDGVMDLIVPNSASNTVSVLLGNGDVNVPGRGNGTFKPKVDYETGSNPAYIALGNLNGDGNLSMAVVNRGDNSISVFRSNANGTFNPKVNFATGRGPGPVAVADLNGDGKDDMIVANLLDNTVSVLLNATLAEATLTPGSLDFGAIALGSPGSPLPVTISSTGSVQLKVNGIILSGSTPGQFSVARGTCPSLTPTLLPGTSCTVQVTFTPSGGGAKSAVLQVSSTDPVHPTQEISLSGTGAVPLALATPASLNFGSLASGSTSNPQAITISNNGTANLVVSGVTRSGADTAQFSVVPGTCPSLAPTIPAGSSCTINIAFAPTSAGPKSAAISIASNAPASPTLNIPVSGTGTVAVIAAEPSAFVFGNQIVSSSSAPGIVTISNSGAAQLVIGSISLIGADPGHYSISPVTCPNLGPTIDPGANCTVSVAFSPNSAGIKSAQIQISSNDPVQPLLQLSLSGTGIITQHTLTVAFAGSGSGTVTGSAQGYTTFSCAKGQPAGCIPPQYLSGTLVSLAATPDWKSNFTAWTGADVAAGNNATILMNRDRTVEAAFNLVTKVRRQPADILYASIQDAYTAAASGDTIQAQSYSFLESLDFADPTISSITLNGGFDGSYQSVTGSSRVRGLIIGSGKVTIRDITIGQ